MNKKSLVIGIPIRNESENIRSLIERLNPVIDEIEAMNISVKVIVNDNASSDGSGEMLMRWAESNNKVTVNHLKFPVSFQQTILRLIKSSSSDAFILLQGDLQDPPELIPKFVQLWTEGSTIVAGVITRRRELFWSRFTRKIFYYVLKYVSDGSMIIGFQDFYLIDSTVSNTLKNLSSEGLFLRGHIASRFGDVTQVQYERADRVRGSSKFNYASKYSLALDGLLLFGTRFIRLLSTLSFILFCVGALGALSILISYGFGYRVPIQGWATLGLLLMTILSLFGMTIGIVLEFLIRIYRLAVLKAEEA